MQFAVVKIQNTVDSLLTVNDVIDFFAVFVFLIDKEKRHGLIP